MSQLRRKVDTLRDHHDGEVLAIPLALPRGSQTSHGERNFGDEDDMCAARHACFESDPSSVAAHHLHHHDAVMRFGGGVDLVDRVGGGVTAVSKPNVTSVAERSLSMVLGTPTIFIPFWKNSSAIVREPSPPIVMIASMPSLREFAMTSSEMSRGTSVPSSIVH